MSTPVSKTHRPSPSTATGDTSHLEPDAERAAAAARRAWAAELGRSAEHITIERVEAVTWPDSSLGCGRPGELYLQVLTPGYRVRLRSDGEVATYHTDRRTDRWPHVVRCDSTTPLGASESLPEWRLAELTGAALDKARRDLERRSKASGEVQLERVELADVAELVCPGTATPPADGPGKVIFELRLTVGGEVHLYRAWGDEVIYCGVVGGMARE